MKTTSRLGFIRKCQCGFLLLFLAVQAEAAVVTWTGAGDGVSWNAANNWSGSAVPGINDDVTINVASNPTITIASAVSVKSLTSAEAISITAGSLTLAAPSSVSAAFTINNATLTVTGATATL